MTQVLTLWSSMSVRGRSERAPHASSEEMQVWQTVRTHLRALETARSSSLAGYEKLLRAHADAKNLDTLYDVVECCVQEEIRCVLEVLIGRCINGALEQLDILMALRRASALPAETRRKKRKTDEANLAEASLETHAKLLEPRKSRSASAARVGEEKGRRAELQNQLPLQRGRKVAFCQPPRDAQSGSEEEWILATVIGTIQGDKYRYVVQDAEDESSGGPYVEVLTQVRGIQPSTRSFLCPTVWIPFLQKTMPWGRACSPCTPTPAASTGPRCRGEAHASKRTHHGAR